MKNLNVIKSRLLDLGQSIVGTCFDADNGDLFFLTSETFILKVPINNEISKFDHDYDFKTIGIQTLRLEDVKFIDFIVENGSLLVVLAEGYIIRIGVSSYSLSSETLYKHDCGISSFKLSPDQDLMVLADKKNNVHVLSSDCQIIQSSNALTQTESLHKPVGVGWGSKETQFFGLDGRPSKEDQLKNRSQLDKTKVLFADDIGDNEKFKALSFKQERATIVDWRGDGQYIASLTYLEDLEKHCLKVWNRNLELQYMSDKLVTVEHGILSWIPNGQYICCAQHREANKNDIAMFEKNGMVHQRISLPNTLSTSHVTDLTWSPDSKILAIVTRQFIEVDKQVTFQDSLLLYTMQNFHYYLKFSCKLEIGYDHSIRWNSLTQNCLHVISSKGSYFEFNCIAEVSSTEDQSTVAVLDGNKILITPFRLCNIPPPMSAIVVECSCSINRFVMNPRVPSDLYIMTMDNKLIHTGVNYESQDNLVEFKIENHVVKSLYELIRTYRSYNIEEVESYQNFIVVKEGLLAASRSTTSGCELYIIELGDETSLRPKLMKKLDSGIVCVPRDSRDNAQNLVMILGDKSTISINLESQETEVLFKFAQTESICSSRFRAAEVIRLTHTDSVISLDKELTLRFNESVIASNCCTSFRVILHYLVYTTTDNCIHFILLEHLLAERIRNINEPPSQTIEIGGTLVIACELESKVILQMPRGNLEILHPRVLVFSALTRLLDDKEYVLAVKMARRHRLNMNFIADYLLHSSANPMYLNQFALDIANHDPSLLNLFLTELEDSDTILNRYRATILHLPPRKVNFLDTTLSLNDSKVNYICSSLDIPDSAKFMQPTLLCFLRQTPRKTQEALTMVHKLGKGSAQTEALKFMLYFIDIDQLFYEALCTYDTDITLMVASASNKDPKEYLTLLDNFNKIEDQSLRCYNIDMHVKRYEEAFESLSKHFLQISSQDTVRKDAVRKDLIDLVESKRLYKHALFYYENSCTSCDKILLETLWSKYASYLWEKRYYPEAGFAYSKAYECNEKEEYYRSARRCYSMVDEWEKILAMAARFSNNDKIHIDDEIVKLSDQLLDNSKCTEVMVIQSQFLQRDKYRPKEFKACLKSGFWYVADFMASYQKDKPELKTEIRLALTDALETKVLQLKDELGKVRGQYLRLKTLLDPSREKESSSGLGAADHGVSDSLSTVDGSEISSFGSNTHTKDGAKSGIASIKTRTSSKSNKSQATRKKRINLREGSRHEDLALALEIKKFIASQKSHQDECRGIVAAFHELTRRIYDRVDYIDSLNCYFQESLSFSQEMIETLWPLATASELKYSLYERFLRKAKEAEENVDFEVLIKPDVSSDIHLFELSR